MAAMRFDKAEDHIHSPFAELMRLFEHPVGLAYSGGGADVDFEPPLLTLWNEVEESLGLDSLVMVHQGPASGPMAGFRRDVVAASLDLVSLVMVQEGFRKTATTLI